MQPAAPAALPNGVTPKDSRPLPCLLLSSLLLLLLLHLLFSSSPPAPSPPPPPPHRAQLPIATAVPSAGPAPPTLAFLLTGSAGDADRLLRLLLATYHPRNIFLLLLDRAASAADRARLAREARTVPSRPNAYVVGDPGFANPRGASALAATLHGAALLLQLGQDWDWFVPLDAADYPLVTPDGSSTVILSRKFIEHCIIVWDASSKNKPRLLTMADIENMTESGAAFGTRFPKDDPVLDHIDEEILHRLSGEPVTGGWCIGVGDDSPCAVSGDPDVIRPGPAAMKLAKFLAQRLSSRNFYSQQCVWD